VLKIIKKEEKMAPKPSWVPTILIISPIITSLVTGNLSLSATRPSLGAASLYLIFAVEVIWGTNPILSVSSFQIV
jgi:hypothetical protein